MIEVDWDQIYYDRERESERKKDESEVLVSSSEDEALMNPTVHRVEGRHWRGQSLHRRPVGTTPLLQQRLGCFEPITAPQFTDGIPPRSPKTGCRADSISLPPTHLEKSE